MHLKILADECLDFRVVKELNDFGEWVFAHKVKDISVIYLRYKSNEIEEIKSALIRQLHKHGSNL